LVSGQEGVAWAFVLALPGVTMALVGLRGAEFAWTTASSTAIAVLFVMAAASGYGN